MCLISYVSQIQGIKKGIVLFVGGIEACGFISFNAVTFELAIEGLSGT